MFINIYFSTCAHAYVFIHAVNFEFYFAIIMFKNVFSIIKEAFIATLFFFATIVPE